LSGHPAHAAALEHKADVEARQANQPAARDVADPASKARQISLLAEGCLSLLLIHDSKDYPKLAATVAKLLMKNA